MWCFFWRGGRSTEASSEEVDEEDEVKEEEDGVVELVED